MKSLALCLACSKHSVLAAAAAAVAVVVVVVVVVSGPFIKRAELRPRWCGLVR